MTVLTQNIVLLTECADLHCNHTDQITIWELRKYGLSICPKCRDDMMILSKEALIQNEERITPI
jgi:hypothetical protein